MLEDVAVCGFVCNLGTGCFVYDKIGRITVQSRAASHNFPAKRIERLNVRIRESAGKIRASIFWAAERFIHALEHFGCGLAGKRECENRFRLDMLFKNKVEKTANERPGFPRAGSGSDDCGRFRAGRESLCIIEVELIHYDSRKYQYLQSARNGQSPQDARSSARSISSPLRTAMLAAASVCRSTARTSAVSEAVLNAFASP